MAQRILFISNGHGEDNHSAHIIKTLTQISPSLEIAALPIVGEGSAYRKLNIPIIGPTQTLPSGGFTYVNRWLLVKDLQAGLLGLTWRQIQAVRYYAPSCNLIHATGDLVGQSFAYLTGKPFISFISCLSALYEGHLQLDLLLQFILRSPRCLAVVTRDPYTAENLTQQGLPKVVFGGIPSLDYLTPTGKDLQLNPELPMVALLPGSRLPEAVRNFKLQLQLVQETALLGGEKIQFRAALVPKLMVQLPQIAQEMGWQCDNNKIFCQLADNNLTVAIICYDDAFSDLICETDLVIGMAGLAVDQAVALGKPVIQIPGEGPQFTYRFAEAQQRLLGLSCQTIGTQPANQVILQEAGKSIIKTLNNPEYLQACVINGKERLGSLGASKRIANLILTALQSR
jgi:uncharacterized protein (TIGR03492 family)